ncbi:hypothetical protein BDA99DRAFT_523870 [Phascolomyces articulosus]|uniref:Uncharacterized protein n=1 Tax=Phascolomyces articulosus TaxID=60185 RepID=A0AAD5JZV2_9FUNG|nr:hypothetical protein BDA99DRAFT_523870 [Phascolomyces articulosus]
MLSTKDCVRHQHQRYYDRHDAAVREKKLENAQLDEAINKFLMDYLPPTSTSTTPVPASTAVATIDMNKKSHINSGTRGPSPATDNVTDTRKNTTVERRERMSATSPQLQNITKRYKNQKDNNSTRKSVTFNNLVQLVMI